MMGFAGIVLLIIGSSILYIIPVVTDDNKEKAVILGLFLSIAGSIILLTHFTLSLFAF